MTIADKIQKINKAPCTSQLKILKNGSAIDIATFWENVIEPLLPNYDVMKKWHELLITYISLPDAVFMIRKGNEESKQYMETVPADALRRGFLTKTDAGYEFTYNDNDFATYMLAMVLDGDIIDTLSANDLKSYLKTPDATIRFNKSGKGGVEKARAFFKINGTPPRISKSGYTVAHIFDVNAHYYDDEIGLKNAGGEEALKSPGINIDKGRYSQYMLQGNVLGKDIYCRDNYHPGSNARKFLEAHMLRFLHPLNYFCAPKDNNNGYVYCEFTDFVNNGKTFSRRFKRVSGYEHLLYYAHYKFKEKYSDIYDDFLKRIMLPANSFDFFENSVATVDYYGSEKIDIQYGNPLSITSGTEVMVKPIGGKTIVKKKGSKMSNTIDLNKISKSYLQKFRACEIAKQVLRVIIEQGAANGSILKSNIDTFKIEKGRNKSTFMLAQPLLSSTIQDVTGHKSYYVDPIVCYGETLYLNSQWGTDEERKENLINWIVHWVKHNGGINKHSLKKITRTKLPAFIKGEEKAPYKLAWRGEDRDSDNIKYADNVLPEQQVPQLCGRLESEYNRIIEFAGHILGDCFSDYFPERIRVELRKECPSRIYFNNDKYVTKKINELIKKREIVTEKEISQILRFEDRIAGLFIDKTPHIVIYFNQFCADTWDEYIAKISKTLAHEYAHYLEYAYCKVNASKSYQDACVSEAIADFFGVLYSVNRGGKYDLKVDEDRYNLWKKREGSNWPYAYALHFLSKPYKVNLSDYDSYEMEKAVKKLREVFQLTPNAKDAYLKLIN